MQRGWEFPFEGIVYYVGAPDAAMAAYYMLQHLRCSADVAVREMPQHAVIYLRLIDGMVIEARTFMLPPPAG